MRAAAITASPAHTSVSLLASATARPAEIGGVGRRQAGGADDRRDDEIGGRERRLDHRLGPAAASIAAAGEAGFQLGVAGGVGDARRSARRARERRAREGRAVAPAGDRRDGEAAGELADHLRAGAADRAGRAENDEPLGSRGAGCGAARPLGWRGKGRVTRSPLKQTGGDPTPSLRAQPTSAAKTAAATKRVEPVDERRHGRESGGSNP